MLASREIHIINNLKANMLIDINIIIPEKIDIIISQSRAIINSCNISMPIEMRTKDRLVSHPVYTKKSIIIPSHSQA